LVSDSATIDGKIDYHEEMERIAMQAGDYTKAEHHRKMKEIYRTNHERGHNHQSLKGSVQQ
jgi:predicted transcriptional regulator YdeE